jgi:hypothetical protein
LLACPIINMYSVGDKLNRICYLPWHCRVLLGQPVDGNNDCRKVKRWLWHLLLCHW